jgi:hypothetical protein
MTMLTAAEIEAWLSTAPEQVVLAVHDLTQGDFGSVREGRCAAGASAQGSSEDNRRRLAAATG